MLIGKFNSEKEATKAAINTLVAENAISKEALKRGLKVSDDEMKELIAFNIKSAKELDSSEFNQFLDGLDVTVEEYYNEYVYNSSKEKLLQNKLFDHFTKDIKDPQEKVKVWNEKKGEIVNEFINEHQEQIQKLKNKYLK